MNRVVVTGYGAISALGLNAEENWQSALAGKSGVGVITQFDISDFPVQLGAEATNFVAEDFIDRKDARRMDRFEQLGVAAAKEALAHSGLEITDENSHRIGSLISSGVG